MAIVRSIDKALFDAVKNGAPLKKVKYIVALGADVKMNDQLYYNCLSYCKDQEVAKYLIEKGVDVNLVGYNGHTPLDFAQDLNVVNLLIKNGADVNAVDCYGASILMHAIDQGNFGKAMMLIKKDADINAITRYGRSVLHYAVNRDAYDIAKYLLDSGCDVNVVDKRRRSLWWDVKSEEMAKLLLSHNINLNGKDIFGVPDFFSIVYNKRINVIKAFALGGGDINITNQNQENALFIIAQRDKEEKQRGCSQEEFEKNKVIVKFLLGVGVDMHKNNVEMQDVLSVADVELRSFILDNMKNKIHNQSLVDVCYGKMR